MQCRPTRSCNSVFGVLVLAWSQRHVTMCVRVLGRLPSLQLVVPRLQGISNRSSVGQHLSVPIGVALPESILVPVPDVVAGGHRAVPPAEPVPPVVGAMSKVIAMGEGIKAACCVGIMSMSIQNLEGTIGVHNRSIQMTSWSI